MAEMQLSAQWRAGNRHCFTDDYRERLLYRSASGELDLNHPFIQHDIVNPQSPKSAIGYIVEALALRRKQGLKAFTVLSCDNVRENGHVAKAAVPGWQRPATRNWPIG